MMNLQGPNYVIDAVMPNSMKNSKPGYPPVPNDRIHIYEIVSSAASFTLTDADPTSPITLLSPTAAGSWTFNPPLEVADFKVSAFAGPGQVEIFTR